VAAWPYALGLDNAGRSPLLTRREALLVGGSTFVYLMNVFHQAHADAEFEIQASPQEGSGPDVANGGLPSQSFPAAPPTNEPDNIDQPAEDGQDLATQLGIAYRAPTFGDRGMTTTQSRATNTPEKPPDYLSVTHNSFFADASNRTFLSSGDSALATALRGDATSSGNASQPTKSAQGALSNFGQLHLQLADSAAGKFLTSVEWSEFAKSTGEWVMDTAFGLLKDKSAEYIAIKLGTEAALPWYAVVSFTHDLLSPVETNGGQSEELTYFDRLSPAEQREFMLEVFRYSPPIPKEMPPDGPTLHRPD
jgi:hypothetical protein